MVTAQPGASPEEESSPARSSEGPGIENHRGGRHRRAGRTNWACVAERVLRGWPTTLRVALLMVIVFSGVITLLVIVAGIAPAVCVAGLGFLARLLGSRVIGRRVA